MLRPRCGVWVDDQTVRKSPAASWLAATARHTAGSDRQALIARRDALLGDLAQLDARQRTGSVAADKYEARRRRLVNELERIYGALDEAGTGPQGGGEGIAA